MPPNKEQRERLQGWLDLGKKLRDQGPDLVERVPSPSTIFEGYCNGTLIPHFHVGIRSSALAKNPQQFCVSLQAGRNRERFVGEPGSVRVTLKSLFPVTPILTFPACWAKTGWICRCLSQRTRWSSRK